MCPLTDHRLAGRTQRQRSHTPHVIRVRDCNGRKTVQGPAGESPVEDRIGQRPLQRLRASRHDAHGRRLKVVRPFEGAPVENAGADAAAEEHGGPAEGAEIEPGKREIDEQADRRDAEQDVPYTQFPGDEPKCVVEDDRSGFRVECERDTDGEYGGRAGYEDEPIDIGGGIVGLQATHGILS